MTNYEKSLLFKLHVQKDMDNFVTPAFIICFHYSLLIEWLGKFKQLKYLMKDGS